MSGKDHFRQCWSQQPVYSGGPVAAIVPEGEAAKAAGVPGLLAMAFGCTLNIMRASDGATVASFDSPLDEDVLLHVAGTGSYPEVSAADAAAEGNGDAPAAGSSNDDAAAGADSGPSPAEVICGSVAFSTESRQIFALRIALDTYTDKYTLTVVKSWTAAQHAIACLRFTPDGSHLASGATDGGLRVWDIHHHHVTHNYRGKGGIVTFVAFATGGRLMAAGTVEGYVSIIDFETKGVIASGRPSNSAFEAASFLPDDSLACIGRDRRIAVFEPRTIKERKAIVLRDHVASASFANAQDFFIGTPDGVITQCRLAPNGSVAVRSRTAPVAHATEAENAIRAIAFLPRKALVDGLAVSAADAETDAEADAEAPAAGDQQTPSSKQHRSEAAAESSADADDNELPLIVAADGSQRLHFITPLAANAPSVAVGLHTEKVLCGYLDQIFDVKLLPPPPAPEQPKGKIVAVHNDDDDDDDDLAGLDEPVKPSFARAVATNSKDVMIFNDGGCELAGCLVGHSDIVTAIEVSADGRFIATASKDEAMRLWRLNDDYKGYTCVGLAEGHDGPVTAVTMNPKMATSSSFVVITVGSDEAIKLWDARKPSADTADSKFRWQPVQTMVNAHLGAIHCVAVAPNDTVVATGGKDKTVNLWALKAKGLTKLGGFAGHRRAVTSLSFAPADRLLISSSNDGSIKVWSLGTMSCARTLQHDKIGVAQARFFNGGHQIVSANAQGIVRVWAVAASEVVNTYEAHSDRVWTLAVEEKGSSTYLVTGGADSCITAFEDFTAEAVQALKHDKADFVLMTQKLQNAIRRKDWATAVKIALKLKHPRHLRFVIVSWLADDEAGCEDGLTDMLAVASHNDLFKMLEFTRTWIANSRHCNVAAVVIAALLRAHHFSALRKMAAVKETIEALAGYNKRHETRVSGVLDQLHYVEYVTRSLRPIGVVAAPATVAAEAAATAGQQQTSKNKKKRSNKSKADKVRAREE